MNHVIKGINRWRRRFKTTADPFPTPSPGYDEGKEEEEGGDEEEEEDGKDEKKEGDEEKKEKKEEEEEEKEEEEEEEEEEKEEKTRKVKKKWKNMKPACRRVDRTSDHESFSQKSGKSKSKKESLLKEKIQTEK